MLGIQLGALEARGTGFRNRGGGAGPAQWRRILDWVALLSSRGPSPPRDVCALVA